MAHSNMCSPVKKESTLVFPVGMNLVMLKSNQIQKKLEELLLNTKLGEDETRFLTTLLLAMYKGALKASFELISPGVYHLHLHYVSNEDDVLESSANDYCGAFTKALEEPILETFIKKDGVQKGKSKYDIAKERYDAATKKCAQEKEDLKYLYRLAKANLNMNDAIGIHELTRGALPLLIMIGDEPVFKVIRGMSKASPAGSAEFLTGGINAELITHFIAMVTSTKESVRFKSSEFLVKTFNTAHGEKFTPLLEESNTREESIALAKQMSPRLRNAMEEFIMILSAKENGQFLRLSLSELFSEFIAIGSKRVLKLENLKEFLQASSAAHHVSQSTKDIDFANLQQAMREDREFYEDLLKVMDEKKWTAVFLENLLHPHFTLPKTPSATLFRIFGATDSNNRPVSIMEVIDTITPRLGGKGINYLPQFPDSVVKTLKLTRNHGVIRINSVEAFFAFFEAISNTTAVECEGVMFSIFEKHKDLPNRPASGIEHLYEAINPIYYSLKCHGTVKVKGGGPDGYEQSKINRPVDKKCPHVETLLNLFPPQLKPSADEPQNAIKVPPRPDKIDQLAKNLKGLISQLVRFLCQQTNCSEPKTDCSESKADCSAPKAKFSVPIWSVIYSIIAPLIIDMLKSSSKIKGAEFLSYLTETEKVIHKFDLKFPGLKSGPPLSEALIAYARKELTEQLGPLNLFKDDKAQTEFIVEKLKELNQSPPKEKGPTRYVPPTPSEALIKETVQKYVDVLDSFAAASKSGNVQIITTAFLGILEKKFPKFSSVILEICAGLNQELFNRPTLLTLEVKNFLKSIHDPALAPAGDEDTNVFASAVPPTVVSAASATSID
uniref:Uncharacterized protein n=1 Tax=viral metagenome TaxID=1070528 RepID=A0A6C0DYK7_9ZZZZ